MCDIFAGYCAHRMGLPISKLILATNENDILSRFFQTGRYARGEVVSTLSPSMDIQVASNFERYLYYQLGEDPEQFAGGHVGSGVPHAHGPDHDELTVFDIEAGDRNLEIAGHGLDNHVLLNVR